MSYLVNSAKKLFKSTALTLSVAIAAGAGIGYMGKQFWPSASSAPSTLPVEVKPLVPKPTPTSATTPVPPSAQPELMRPASPAMPVLPVAGNLAIITSHRATLAEKKLQKEIEELEAKSASSSATASSAVVLSTEDVAKMLAVPDKTPASAPSAPATPAISVVAVQGVDGKLTATLRHNGKLVTLATGEKFAGGTITSISRQRGVSIRAHNGVQTLAFE